MSTYIWKETDKVPESTLRGLPWYLSDIKSVKEKGEQYVSFTQTLEEINIDAPQIAKDSSYAGISGRTRVGYNIDVLIKVLGSFFGFTNMHKAFLFGVGSLRVALLRDSGLYRFGLEIVAAFDMSLELVGKDLSGTFIYHFDDFEAKMKEYDVNIGVLTVSIDTAQEAIDKMVNGGIKAVWDFTSFRIRASENIAVQGTPSYVHPVVMLNRLSFDKE